MSEDFHARAVAQVSEYMTVKEFSQLTRTPESTCLWWRHVGRGPRSFKVGRRVLYLRSDVEEWLQEQYRTTGSKSA